jgi:hypothetical protein
VKEGGTLCIRDNSVGRSTSTFNDCNASVGYGGAIAIYSVDESSGIIFSGKSLSFARCYSLFGKHIFIGSNNFDSTYNKITFDYNYDISDVNNLIGFTWSISNSQIIILYNYLCEIRGKYIWSDISNDCIEYEKCEDICSTGTDGLMNYILNVNYFILCFT